MMARTALKSSAKAKNKGSSSALPWPANLRPTPVRKAWHERLSQLPPGLPLREMCKKFGEPYASIAFWARRFDYPFTKLRRGRKSSVNWSKVDWRLKNSQIARQLNVSGERVRQVRLERKLPPTPRFTDGGVAFRAYVRKHRKQLENMSIREMIAASGADISTATAHFILKKSRMKAR